MSDDKTPKQGRDLSKITQQSTASTATEAALPEPEKVVPAGRFAPDPEPSFGVGDDPVRAQVERDIAPKVLVWNTTAGLRVGISNTPQVDADGKAITDAAGLPMVAESVKVFLKPGLNLVPSEQWTKIRPGLEKRIAMGEVQFLGDDPRAVGIDRLKRAIDQTGLDAPLFWVAERDDRMSVVEAIHKQRLVFDNMDNPKSKAS